MTRARLAWLAAVLAIAWLAARGDDGSLLARRLPSLARNELDALDAVTGLRAEDGTPRSDALAVRVDGDADTVAVVRELVADDPLYRLADGPHRIDVEVIALAHACALRLSLERRGWLVHAPKPSRARLLPALALVPTLLGIAVFSRRRARVLGLGVAAVLAQLACALWPWPEVMPPGRTLDDVAQGPLVAPLLALARGLDDLGTSVAAGVIALCVVLAWFDHRRSRARGTRGLLRGLAAVVAALALAEAATRSGWAAWSLTALGAIAAAMLVVVLATAARVWERPAPAQEPPR